MNVLRITSCRELPPEWDAHCSSVFQRRAFLEHCSLYNPCSQRYYLFYSSGIFVGGAVVYSLKIDLLTFLRIPSPLVMHIAGIPCSVSCSGIIGSEEYFSKIAKELLQREKGFLLFLNRENLTTMHNLAYGRTFPTIVLQHDFTDWQTYLAGLRHEYRRRIGRIEAFAKQLTIANCPLDTFSKQHHELYLKVFNRSGGKLEKLTLPFFKNLPASFSLTTFTRLDTLVGWTLGTSLNGTYYFFLGGQDYAWEPRMVYLAKVLNLVKTAVSTGHKTIDLGQSAEVPKLRFGGRISERYMAAHHSNGALHAVVWVAKGLLSYTNKFDEPQVFKASRV
jgi:hypothetical protein